MLTENETKKVIAVVTATFPMLFQKYDKGMLDLLVESWRMSLEDYTYEQVSTGLKLFLKADTSGMPPTPAMIIDQITKHSNTIEHTMNGLEAWALVSLAIRNSNYHSEEEFDKLPAIVQKAVGSPATLREWASMDSNTVHSVEQSNFMRTFDAVAKRVREDAKLPPEYRMPIEQQTTALLIEEQETDNGERASAEEIDEMIRGLAEKMEVKR